QGGRRRVSCEPNKHSACQMNVNSQHLAKLQTYWKANKAFPSMAKLAEVLGLSSTASVFELVGKLSDAGYLRRVEGRVAPGPRFFARPLVGSVRAGVPDPVGDESHEALTLDDYLVDDPARTVLCRVRGDSMRDAGLLDGDLVVVQRNSPTA